MIPLNDLNYLVAIHVMGYKKMELDPETQAHTGLEWIWEHLQGALRTEVQRVPNFSGDSGTAMAVVEKMIDRGYDDVNISFVAPEWHVFFSDYVETVGEADTDSLALSICLAALNCLKVDITAKDAYEAK